MQTERADLRQSDLYQFVSRHRVSSDICRYVHTRVKEHSGLKRWRDHPEAQQEIETALTAKAGGMFRWVVCQLDALEKCLDLPTLRKALDSLPPDLDETYARIVQRIPPQHLPHAIRILQLLLYADRPLPMDAAVDALAVNPDERPRFNPKNRMPDPKEITVYCSSLVSLTSRAIFGDELEEDREVLRGTVYHLQFTHFSVKEWLISKRVDSKFGIGLDETTTRTSIARVCLSYLVELESSIEQYARHGYDVENQIGWWFSKRKRPFGKYATNSWREHALSVENTSQQVRDMVLEYFLNETAYRISSTLWLSWDAARWAGTSNKLSFPLLCASHEGFTLVAEELLRKGANVDEAGDGSKNALHLATAAGHETLVKMLLRNGADPNIVIGDSEWHTALHLAAEQGHYRTVRVLLEHGSRINDAGCAAMRKAIEGRHVETVRVLLDNEAQTRTNMLAWAMRCRSTEIFQMLLDAGVDVHGPCGGERDALTLVLVTADLEAVEAYLLPLLEKGANTADKGEGNALYLAAVNGCLGAVVLLLDWGVDVNETGGKYGTALQACSVSHHVSIARELLKRGANPNLKNGEYGNALYAAVGYRLGPARGHDARIPVDDKFSDQEEVVSLLIEHGADLFEPNLTYPDALHAALREGTLEVVSILLEHIKSTNSGWRLVVTRKMLEFAAGNPYRGKPIMTFLLERCDPLSLVSIWEMRNATTETELPDQDQMQNPNQGRNAQCVLMTSTTIEATARNFDQGVLIFELLSQRLGQDITVTEGVFLAALRGAFEGYARVGGSHTDGAKDMLMFLLDRCKDDSQITRAVLGAAGKLGRSFQTELRTFTMRHMRHRDKQAH